ncbi:hypothetical protein [Tumebacillus flagellatus]|uniref:Uncharacterized protein n=1 Tax=Tumebacillus flagellatus TaxID=1157490 RepID=A0A074M639_9BACL|nr:hypothetical protein [Tumebacillus flagellatus]KEO81477.1 hypothetical protein EL26_20590 [Tumebacillus flagellatus]
MMVQDVWSLIGVDRKMTSESDKILTDIFLCYFKAIEDIMGVSVFGRQSFEEVLQEGLSIEGDYKHFWRWLDEFGAEKMNRIASLQVSNSDKTLDFLDSELYTLQTLLDEGEEALFVHSMVDSISELYRTLSQVSVTVEKLQEVVPHVLQGTFEWTLPPQVSMTHEFQPYMSMTSDWMSPTTMPADDQRASLCA